MTTEFLTDEQLADLLSATRASYEMQKVFGSAAVIEEWRRMLLALEELTLRRKDT